MSKHNSDRGPRNDGRVCDELINNLLMLITSDTEPWFELTLRIISEPLEFKDPGRLDEIVCLVASHSYPGNLVDQISYLLLQSLTFSSKNGAFQDNCS